MKAPPPSTPPWDAWNAISCPTLVIRGGDSDILGAAVARKMCEALADCRLVEVPGVGHAPSLSEPEAAKAVEEFLAG